MLHASSIQCCLTLHLHVTMQDATKPLQAYCTIHHHCSLLLLQALLPEEMWNDFHLKVLLFGREYCPAQRHNPQGCPICSWAAVQPFDKVGDSPAQQGRKRKHQQAADQGELQVAEAKPALKGSKVGRTPEKLERVKSKQDT